MLHLHVNFVSDILIDGEGEDRQLQIDEGANQEVEVMDGKGPLK